MPLPFVDFHGNRVLHSGTYRASFEAGRPDAPCYGSSSPIELDGKSQQVIFDGKPESFAGPCPISDVAQLERVLRFPDQVFESGDVLGNGQPWQKLETGALAHQGVQLHRHPDGVEMVFEPSRPDTMQPFQQVLWAKWDSHTQAVHCVGESFQVLEGVLDGESRSPLVARFPTPLEPDSFGAHLREQLRARGFNKDQVLLRLVSSDRLDVAVRTGTDRDGNSTLFNLAPSDCTASVREEFGIADQQVTYAHHLDLNTLLTQSAPPGTEPITLTEIVNGLRPYSEVQGFLVYDPDQVRHGPGSDVEYWLPPDPRKALLLVLAPPCPPPIG